MAINNEDQQFCLRWNNFQAYITSQFETLRDDEEFVDVTLACEGQRLGAHKVVLSACSPFFKELFKTNPCSHPIIFMRDVELQHVMALLEFMYAGEVNVAQQNLSGFLKTAESLQIRGLTDASKDQQENEHYPSNTPTPYPPTQCIKKKPEPKQSPTRLITQDKREAPVSPVPRKRSKTDLEDTDRLTDSETDVKHQKSEDSSINPFALVPSKIHTEIDISQELIEPKLELPDYSEEDTSHDESQNFIDVNDTNNSYATSTGGPDTVPGTSGAVDPSLESQELGRRTRLKTRTSCRRRADEWLHLPLTLEDEGGNAAAAGDMLSRIVDWRARDNQPGGVVKLAEGIEILEEQLRGVKWSDYRKLTRGLATILFSPVELATCSVTGQRWSRAGNGERPVKPALDRAKVQAIISYVATRFPMVEISRIKQVLAYKCKENSTAFKMKAIRYFGEQQIRSQCNRP